MHGGFWMPIGLLSAIAAVGNRPMAAGAALALVDEIDCGSYAFRKLLGRRKTAVNVIAERGDPDAPRTVVVMAHHDAAQSGLIFHSGPAALDRHELPERDREERHRRADVVAGRDRVRRWRRSAAAAAPRRPLRCPR